MAIAPTDIGRDIQAGAPRPDSQAHAQRAAVAAVFAGGLFSALAGGELNIPVSIQLQVFTRL